jgi:NAD(P)-dependent dehydrogenase (short-subunit alcohol dehydrogenase family)
MKVVILGGYGVFGSRLAELLVRDGRTVWIAGRSLEKARACASRLGAHALAVDRDGDLAPILDASPDVVVDAAGPFQAYGEDPHRLARFCLEQGVGYLDLADDAAFTAGVTALDGLARSAGRFAISGASSVPGLSSAVVAALADGLDSIAAIEVAIAPGNRAPRGRSLIAAVLAQIGLPMRMWRGGRWREAPCWGDRRVLPLGAGAHRTVRTIGAPDLALFPERFAARSVTFRVGLELGVLNVAISALAALRHKGASLRGPRFLSFALAVARLFEPFGSDRGGMWVDVIGDAGGAPVRRRWALVADSGEGPYVPAVVVRALLRRIDRIAPGARPCVAEISLEEAEDAMADLAVTTTRTEEPRPTLFQAALGEAWRDLPSTVRRLHDVHDVESCSGRATVERGRSLPARLAAWFFRFPEAGEDVPVTVTMARTATGETWERNFAGRRFKSHLAPSGPGRIRERFWVFDYEQDLPVRDGALHFPVRRGWCLGVPIPGPLLPRSDALEFERDGVFHFDVALSAPLGGGLIVRYRGFLVPDASEPNGAVGG